MVGSRDAFDAGVKCAKPSSLKRVPAGQVMHSRAHLIANSFTSLPLSGLVVGSRWSVVRTHLTLVSNVPSPLL